MELAEFIWNSNMIENIDEFDLEQTQYAINALENKHTAQLLLPPEVADHYKAWEYLEDTDLPLTETVILITHRILMKRLLPRYHAGTYRNLLVSVGGRICPESDKVPALVADLVQESKYLTPKEWHIKFEMIHPFVDGNGRVGRLIMRKMAGPNVYFKDREKYYNWFH